MVTRHISRIRLMCKLASRHSDVRHHDSQPHSKTARNLALEPLRDVAGAEDLAAQRAKGLGRVLEPSFNVVVGQVVAG